MHTHRRTLLALAAALTVLPLAAQAQVPAGYPANYGDTVAAAKKEGKLVVYSATDSAAATPLVKDFEALYPGVKVEYHDMSTTEIYNRVISEKAAGGTSGDFVWSSAMDLQVKLVNDGYALSYASPEIPKVPGWAVWKNEAYGTTYEPISIMYNKRLVPADQVPQTHADVARLLSQNFDKFKGKVTSYDIEKSGLGFLLITQDSKGAGFWDMAKALGSVSTRWQSSSGTMMERVGSGEALLAYNIIGSYAMTKAKKDPSIGYVFPKDYTLVMSRVAYISKTAAHPNAAKLWLDYLLSQRGQSLLGKQAELGSIRADVDAELTPARLSQALGAAVRPIPVGPELLGYLNQAKRLEFLKEWQGVIKGAVK